MSVTARIVLASGDGRLRQDLRASLECEGYRVTDAVCADDAIDAAHSGVNDLLVLDSDLNGRELSSLCRAMRAGSNLAIIALLRCDSQMSRIDALNSGADDYVAVRFAVAELLARVRAVLRRVRRSDDTPAWVHLQDRAVVMRAHKINGPATQISHLTPKEFQVLQYLMVRAGQLVTNRDLAQTLWQRDGSGDLEYVRIVICQLRRKIERDHRCPKHIVTERSLGYRFMNPPPAAQSGTQATVPSECTADEKDPLRVSFAADSQKL
jgi:two-component system KDP operon response regulator KdpE